MAGNLAKSSDFHATLGIFYMPQICNMGLYFPSEGRRAEALKNPTASAGFEPVNLGTKGQHATSRPPKPHVFLFILFKMCMMWPYSGEVMFVCLLACLIIHRFHLCECYLDFKIFAAGSLH